MPDIDSDIRIIQLATRGEEVRDAIVDALRNIDTHASPPIDTELSASSENAVQNKVIYAALSEKQGSLSFDTAPESGSSNPVTSGGIYTALQNKQDKLSFDTAPEEGSRNPVTSSGVHAALQNKQDALAFDTAPEEESNNPVTSGGVYAALQNKQDHLSFDAVPAEGSNNPVASGGIYAALQNKQDGIRISTLSLAATWNGSGPYTQEITIPGTTQNSKVDLQPDAAVLTQMLTDGVTALWVQNDAGTLTIYALGAAPTQAISVQCSMTEV